MSSATQPDLQTTIMIVAPHNVQAIAVPTLRRYAMDTLIRVPAHFTVMYPFVSVDRLPDASRKVRALCADVAPFEITISDYDNFPGVAFIAPDNPAPIQAVFRRIYSTFPECPPYNGAFGDDLHPHMTVGEFADSASQEAAELPAFEPVTFRVEWLHIMYGSNHLALPWLAYDVIPLGG